MTRSLTAGGPILRDFWRLVRDPDSGTDSDIANSYSVANLPARTVDMGPFDGLLLLPFGTDADGETFIIQVQRLFPYYTDGTATPGIDDAPAGYMASVGVQLSLTLSAEQIGAAAAGEFTGVNTTDLIADAVAIQGSVISGGDRWAALHSTGGAGSLGGATIMVHAMGAPKMLVGVSSAGTSATRGVFGCRYQAQSHPRP